MLFHGSVPANFTDLTIRALFLGATEFLFGTSIVNVFRRTLTLPLAGISRVIHNIYPWMHFRGRSRHQGAQGLFGTRNALIFDARGWMESFIADGRKDNTSKLKLHNRSQTKEIEMVAGFTSKAIAPVSSSTLPDVGYQRILGSTKLLELIPEPLVAIQSHFSQNFPYVDELSDVSVEVNTHSAVLFGTIRSHYLRQTALSFATVALNGRLPLVDRIDVREEVAQ